MNNDFITTPEIRAFRDYANYLYGYVISMFKWQCDFAPEWVFERMLTTRGHCGIFRDGKDGAPVVAAGGYTGAPTIYGFGQQYIGTDLAGNSYTGTVGDDVVVLWNNYSLSSDAPTISAYANRYVETEKSVLNVIRGTRITNLVTADDTVDKLTLDNVVSAINNGDTVVKIPPSYREIDALDSGAKRFDVMQLTDPKETDKLQYLSRFRDDLLAAFLNEYGVDVSVVNKGSQVSRDELHSMENATRAIIEQRLECRARDLDIVRGWGYNITVTPNVGRSSINADTNADTNTDTNTDTDTERGGENGTV